MQKILSYFLLILILLSNRIAYAEVRTESNPQSEKNSVYIIGNPDSYPVEYFDDASNEFKGVVPQILNNVSKRTGINFTYIHSDTEHRTVLAEKLKAELISTYTTNQNASYSPDTITILSYLSDDKTVNIGWRVTKYADRELIDTLKTEIESITENEINAIFLEVSKENSPATDKFSFVVILCILLIVSNIFLILILLRRLRKRLQLKETTDSTTGIGNLMYFEKRFKELSSNLNYIAYFVVDSNYLQLYHGETTLTDAIKYIADTLSAYASNDDFVARITENGFAMVFAGESETSAKEYMHDLVEQLLAYIEAKNGDVTPYFRVVLYRLNESDRNCDLLLFNLRKNCAKLMGTGTVYSVCNEQTLYSDFEQKTFIEDISNGLKNKEFKLYLQFVLDNKTKEIVSAEALSRWDRGEKGIIMPSEYIGITEKTGMISKLDYYMFENTCIQLHKWKDTEFNDITISCNFTRITLSERDFIEHIKEILSRYVFDKNRIIIEITEDAIEKNRDIAVNNILACKKLGFRIALDDLGNGYTSLTNLCDYPIDIVKIDRSILLKTEQKSGRDLFSGIVSLAHSLGLKVVCEGVETPEHHTYVTESDCDFVQGWYYSRPSGIQDCEKFYKSYLGNHSIN